jgi:hypothetical protein
MRKQPLPTMGRLSNEVETPATAAAPPLPLWDVNLLWARLSAAFKFEPICTSDA